MKKTLQIVLFTVAIVVITGCSAQERAQRKVRRAVELCPELMQAKAHLIDTVITVPAFTDRAKVPVDMVLEADAVFVGTEHGMLTLSLDKADSSLAVAFSAAPSEIRYQDTVRYNQVIVGPETKAAGNDWSFRNWLATLVCGLGLGGAVVLWLISKHNKNLKT